ncbi:MAG: GNAT family protein [Hyphomonas sp.]|nr:GNAT family protein [Hyphomonas sp.]
MRIEPVTLENPFVRLVPFDVESHADALRDMAERSGQRLATWPYFNPPGDWISVWVASIRKRAEAGALLPFAVLMPDGGFAGMTAYLNPDAVSKNVEIGMTIYAPQFQGGAVNPACKHLLLEHAFGQGAIRVCFNVDERNARSRAAMAKLGAVQEGVLRDNRILPDGFVRSTVVFSVLAREWPAVKAGLEARLTAFEAQD